MKKNILIVGAGFSGSTIARILVETGKYKVAVIDKRDHVAGNAFDYVDEISNIRVHQYGPHLFHTSNEEVFAFLSTFTEWNIYKHKVKAYLKDKGIHVTIPVNRETKEIVGEDKIIETFIRPYTEKMWGLPLEKVSKSVLNRVPVRNDDNEYYFPEDKFQVLPKLGYTNLINNILDHKDIQVYLNMPFDKEMESHYDHVFNSMAIDEYYNYEYGELPYRSIKFKTEKKEIYISDDCQSRFILPVATVNFTYKNKFTRVTEWNRLPNSHGNFGYSIITYEEPCDYKDNNFERYYPVKDLDGINRNTYNKYKKIENPKTTFIGRLGLYAYLNMDQAINSSMKIAKEFIDSEK